MIDALLFSVAIFAIGFGFAFFADQIQALQTTVNCRCGAVSARDILLVDPIDRKRIAAALAENCPICRNEFRPAGRIRKPTSPTGGRPVR